jgi:hypothetical protein
MSDQSNVLFSGPQPSACSDKLGEFEWHGAK